jgi:pimeloyl-ACP methyl ester carboxylesterase
MKRTLYLTLSLVAFGATLAHLVQTDFGAVRVKDVRFTAASGNTLSGLLYIPRTATPDSPAPAVLAVHGYINSRETQSGFAIEFARRGFVVLALDQTGHGYSDPPAFGEGFGGPAGLAYLGSLPIVDASRIGLEGHSMGGWAVQVAAASAPADYAAMVLEGSSTGTFGAPPGTPETPRNLLVVFSLFDEFSALMWGSPVPADIVATEKLRQLFGTTEAVEPGLLYGDSAAGTARRLEMPAVTHPGDHHSRTAIAPAIDWFETTLDHASGIGSENQVWYWKELGTLLILIGLGWLIFPLADRLVVPGSHANAVIAPPTRFQSMGLVVLAAVVPVLSFFPLNAIANLMFPASAFMPQQITNGILLWALGTGVISLIGFYSIWYRSAGVSPSDMGAPLDRRHIANALGRATLVVAILYGIILALEFLLTVDARFWVVALKRMSLDQFIAFLIYLPGFTLFFLILAATLHGPDVRAGLSGSMVRNASMLAGGFVVLLIVQYVPLFLGGTLAIASQPLLTIIAFQFVPLLALAALVSTFCWYRTGTIYTGAFINSILITWYMVAGTAMQVVPAWGFL